MEVECEFKKECRENYGAPCVRDPRLCSLRKFAILVWNETLKKAEKTFWAVYKRNELVPQVIPSQAIDEIRDLKREAP